MPRQIVHIAPGRAESAGSASRTIRFTLVISAVLHAGALAGLIVWRSGHDVIRPPTYRVELIGAKGMVKQAGVVAEPTALPPAPTPAPAAAERPKEPPKTIPPKNTKAKPIPAPPKATANQAKPKTAGAKTEEKVEPKTALPTAGSGSKTAKGTDVTNMVSEGIDFPYPGYLNRIIREIKLRFDATKGSALVAELRFMIHRDGSVTDIVVLTPSGRRSFDLDASGAIEGAGRAGAFGPLPAGFHDDVLPVFFTFAPDKPPAPGQ